MDGPLDRSPHLLLLEEDADLGANLREYLGQEGYAVHVVTSLEAALLLVEAHAFDLILVELSPDLHGDYWRAALELRERVTPTPVGVFNRWLQVTPSEAQARGFVCFLEHPLEVDRLATAVAACLCVPRSVEPRR